jgi:hypothetical protein
MLRRLAAQATAKSALDTKSAKKEREEFMNRLELRITEYSKSIYFQGL